MTLYQCGCGFGSTYGARAEDIINHVRGKHDVDVKTGHSHFAHCNEDYCLRTNGHGRRLHDMRMVIRHLSDRHYIEIEEFYYVTFTDDDYWIMTTQVKSKIKPPHERACQCTLLKTLSLIFCMCILCGSPSETNLQYS